MPLKIWHLDEFFSPKTDPKPWMIRAQNRNSIFISLLSARWENWTPIWGHCQKEEWVGQVHKLQNINKCWERKKKKKTNLEPFVGNLAVKTPQMRWEGRTCSELFGVSCSSPPSSEGACPSAQLGWEEKQTQGRFQVRGTILRQRRALVAAIPTPGSCTKEGKDVIP